MGATLIVENVTLTDLSLELPMYGHEIPLHILTYATGREELYLCHLEVWTTVHAEVDGGEVNDSDNL